MNHEGVLTTNKHGHLKSYGNVWYNTKDISNIISMSNLNNKYRIIYDSDNGYGITVINKISGGHNMISTANNGRIYYNNMSNTKGLSILSNVE